MRPTLYHGVSAVALAAVSTLGVSTAFAQVSGSDAIETVTVTGTSIRGVAPIGSNLITVGQDQIQNLSAATVNQMLTNIPAITGLNSDGRGQSGNGGAGSSIYIHEVGASAQNSTLVIMDGHRMPVSGSSNATVDPSLIPQAMIQRVEVLADGSSTTYGSDAVSGVVNFITRKSFDGIQVHYQAEVEHGSAVGTIASFLAGHSWDGGGVVGSYDYTFEGDIHNPSDWETNPLAQATRAANNGLVTTTGSTTYFGSFNCDPATIQPNGSGNIYTSVAGTSNFANVPQNAFCSNWAAGSVVPAERTQHAMMRFNQNITPNLNFSMDALWGLKQAKTQSANATLTATAFGTGTQANPFYVNPPGVSATKQTIRYDFTDLIGPEYQLAGNSDLMGDADLNWNIDDNWNLDGLVSLGTDDEFSGPNVGAVNSSVADLMLNGSPNTAGTIAAGTAASTAVANTQTSVNNLPLTTSNALDVWDPIASNKTSAAALALLKAPGSNESITHGINSYQQYRIIANGTLFDLPGGPLKVAVGIEQFNSQKTVTNLTNGNAGPSTVSSAYSIQINGRTVQSEFVEADVPVVNPSMNIPFMQSFEVNLAARHDQYNDFGAATNPKIAFNWQVIDDLKLRANYSTSFVAPDLFHDVPPGGVNGTVSPGSTTTLGAIPVALYPQVTTMGIPGCTTASVTCNVSATLNGVTSTAVAKDLTREVGHGWSMGFDYVPSWLEGFTSSVSWWTVHYFGGATAATAQIDAFNPGLNNRIVLFPPTAARGNTPCATTPELSADTLGVPFTAALPACVSYILQTQTANLINFWASGIDISLQYKFDSEYGSFTVGDDLSEGLTFLNGFSETGQPVPSAAYRFEVENTDGLNTTFPNVQTQMRVHLDWAMDDYLAGIGLNYVGGYRNVSSTSTVLIGTNANNVYNNTGGDPVKANKVFDAHVGYHFNGSQYLGDDQILFTVRDLFNSSPPFFNGPSGYDSFVASPIGRTLELSLTSKF